MISVLEPKMKSISDSNAWNVNKVFKCLRCKMNVNEEICIVKTLVEVEIIHLQGAEDLVGVVVQGHRTMI